MAKVIEIQGTVDGKRVTSKDLEEQIQKYVKEGFTHLKIYANGQHGIGGRLFFKKEDVLVEVFGAPGQRLGSMGTFGTKIVVHGSCSDDVGWLNTGATIVVFGDVTNGAHNAGAQGKLYVQGGGGARCDTMTKQNPRFEPLQSWYFRDVGDSFAEFKAGGIAVVCGVNPRNPDNILGYRPCVGMVGGVIYFRGKAYGWSEKDVHCEELDEKDWKWLTENMKDYLKEIQREEYYDELTKSIKDWKKLVPYTPQERAEMNKPPMSMHYFRKNVWEKEVGDGGIFGDLMEVDDIVLPYIVTGEYRRRVPKWENEKFNAPCAYACSIGIPTQKRTALIRNGELEEAINLVLQYSPFPVTVCGHLCPNPCMTACSREVLMREPVDIAYLGRISEDAKSPEIKEEKDKKIAIIGGGPAGLSAAYHLRLLGYKVTIFEKDEKLGGKVEYCIPKDRFNYEAFLKEIDRIISLGVEIKTNVKVDKELFEKIKKDYDRVIIAAGAYKAKLLKFEGIEDVIPAIDYLRMINTNNPIDVKGKTVAVIGAGRTGMDAATSGLKSGAKEVIAIARRKPRSWGEEHEEALKMGVKIVWPKFVKKYDKNEGKIYFTDGDVKEFDLALISIGEYPVLDFIEYEGFMEIDEFGRTNLENVYAIGDVTKEGLLTDAIGHARKVSYYIDAELSGKEFSWDNRDVIPYERVKWQYYEKSKNAVSPEDEADRCFSCGYCRDCHICELTCFEQAISRVEKEDGSFEYIVDDNKCIGCGFCEAVCPCGIWVMYDV